MTTPHDLEGLTKARPVELARVRDVAGRSRMTKNQLVEALLASPAAPGPATPPTPQERRHALSERLAALVDTDRRCTWRDREGNPCGLPPITGQAVCALHGGIDVFDAAVPVTGRLCFDTWPTLGRHLAMAEYDVDPIGLDPLIAEMVWHLANFLYFDYFKVEVDGIENVPVEGPGLIVGNHGGAALPYDALMLTTAVANEALTPRRLRVIGTEIFNMLPWLSHLYRKSGAAYASRGDVAHLLRNRRLVGVFPEGERGFMKPVWEAYRIQRFGRGGFLELAEAYSAPVIPVAIVGSEEVHPAVGVSGTLAKLVRLVWPEQRVDEMAVVLNPIPLPVRWRIRFLPPLEPAGGDAAADPLWVLERTETIRRSIQDQLDDILRVRRTSF